MARYNAKPENERKSEIITFRVTKAKKKAYSAHAVKKGKKLIPHIVDLLEQDLKRG